MHKKQKNKATKQTNNRIAWHLHAPRTMEDDEEEEEEIVGSLLSSLENILLRGTNISQDKMRNQSEKDHLLSRHTSLYATSPAP